MGKMKKPWFDFNRPLSKKRIKEIKTVVNRIFKEYGEVIRKLN